MPIQFQQEEKLLLAKRVILTIKILPWTKYSCSWNPTNWLKCSIIWKKNLNPKIRKLLSYKIILIYLSYWHYATYFKETAIICYIKLMKWFWSSNIYFTHNYRTLIDGNCGFEQSTWKPNSLEKFTVMSCWTKKP